MTKFSVAPIPDDFYNVMDNVRCYRMLGDYGENYDYDCDMLTVASRKYSVDKFRQKRKHRKMYKFFIKINK